MKKQILVFGCTGKMGYAIMRAFQDDYDVVGLNSKDFDAKNIDRLKDTILKYSPDIVINCAAKTGMTLTERNPIDSFIVNTLFPRKLAQLSNELDFLLVHFTTDAIIENSDTYITESSQPNIINIYSLTKYGADCFIKGVAKRYYNIRISLLFGEVIKPFHENVQYVEGIFSRIVNGERKFEITDEMLFTPTYSLDVAKKVKEIIEKELEYGLYIVANEGSATLYDFTVYLFNQLYDDLAFTKISSDKAYEVNNRNIKHPMKSEKIRSMRNWENAVDEYCKGMKDKI